MKKILYCVATFSIAITMSACNRSAIDTTWKYDKAIIYLPNGSIVEGEVESWRDYEDGDQIQVTIDGITYLVHSENIVLMKENKYDYKN